jgi:flagellar motility protein MotE (MotC chaperone)
MKKIIFLAVLGLVSFLAGTVGLYVAMPRLAPQVVDSTRVKLDSLGLITIAPPETLATPTAAPETIVVPAADSAAFEAAVQASAKAVSDSLTRSYTEIIGRLSDSLTAATKMAQNLQRNSTALAAQLEELKKRKEAAPTPKVDTAELVKSITKLDDDQLANLLTGIDLSVIETLYMKSSARERTRLLQNMAPDRAAVFVRTLVKGPLPVTDAAPVSDKQQNDEQQNGPSNQ